jgi:hypothetical protein
MDNVSEIFSKMIENVIHPSEGSKIIVIDVTIENPNSDISLEMMLK